MKTMFGALLACLTAYSACAQTNAPAAKHHKKKSATNDAPGAADAASAPAPSDPVGDQVKMVQQYQKLFAPTDPWRIMSERTNYAKGPDWVQFEGRVTRVSGEGLVLQGWYGEPLAYMMPAGAKAGATGVTMTSGTFLLTGYPRNVAVGQLLSRNDRLVALKSGTKDDMVNLEYGTVWVQQLTEEQKTAVADAKSKTAAKVLAWQREQAEKGDAYGEYKMGVRYLNGDGVDKDLVKAREWLTKSADQGNKDAADELLKIPAH